VIREQKSERLSRLLQVLNGLRKDLLLTSIMLTDSGGGGGAGGLPAKKVNRAVLSPEEVKTMSMCMENAFTSV
jgi:hypothetical protein